MTSARRSRFRASTLLWAAVAIVGAAGASCDSDKHAEEASAETEPSTAAPQVKTVPGVDTSELISSEVEVWQDLINEQLSPCGDPVTVGQCAQTRGQCPQCRSAARYLARLVGEGFEQSEIAAMYRKRYGEGERVEIPDAPAPVRGSPAAPITIVEFSDFECPHCAAAAPVLKGVVEANPGKVKLIFRHFPLTGHEQAKHAAKAAVAAGEQDKFWDMQDLLFQNQRALTPEDVEGYAKQIGLDIDQFRKDLEAPETAERVQRDREIGEKLGITGTPAIYVNGRRFEEPLTSFPAYIKEEIGD